MNVSFVLDSKPGRSKSLIMMICRWSGKTVKYSTSESVYNDLWDKKSQSCITGKRFVEGFDINIGLANARNEIVGKYRNFKLDFNREPTIDEVKLMLRGNGDRALVSPIDFFLQYLEESKTKINGSSGKTISENTRKIYRIVIDRIVEFNREYPVTWNSINEKFYSAYIKFLSDRYAKNSVGKHISKLKSFLREAESRGLPVNSAYKSRKFSSMSEPSSRIHLSPFDLKKLKDAQIHDLKLRELRDIFLVSCYSGLRFSDWPQLPYNLNRFVGMIALSRQMKTGNPALVPIHDDIAEICDRLRNGIQFNKNMVNQVVNRQLKHIGEIAGIVDEVKQEITKYGRTITTMHRKCDLIMTHTGRRTFATNTYRSGFDTKALSVIMGFTSEQQLVKYLKVGDFDRAQMLKKHWSAAQ